MIDEIINLLRRETDYKYCFGASPKIAECVVYGFDDCSDDGIKKRSRLTLRIVVTGTDERALVRLEEMAEKINSVIVTRGDNALTGHVLSLVQSGGETHVDAGTKTAHKICAYDVLWR